MKVSIVFSLLVIHASAQIPSALYSTFYPRNINTTEWITNNSIGTYGGVYQDTTYESTSKAPYGT